MIENSPRNTGALHRRGVSLAVIAAGIVAGQVYLYGPAFVGTKVLLPLGCLAERDKYIPTEAGRPVIESPQPILLDLVVQSEPARRFAAREIAEGRFPRWTPHLFGGVPFTYWSHSPFFLFSALSPSPIMLAWTQLIASLVAGFGAFAFCRRTLKLSFWPSTLAAWCYPITGWFVLFQGFAISLPVVWLPWLCYAIDRAIRGTPAAGPPVALLVALTAVSGNTDVAGQVFMVSALFTAWRSWDLHRDRFVRFMLGRGGLRLAAACGLGLLLAAPQLLPLHEYGKTSDRLERRNRGAEERPPIGVAALPQLVLPDMYGSFGERGTAPLMVAVEGNQLESPSAAYTGLLATLLLAPWAFFLKRKRSESIFLLSLAGFGVAWALNIPGLVHLLRLPGLNLMSHNRLVFSASFAVLILAAIGLEALLEGELDHPRHLWPQTVVLVVLLGWCLYRSTVMPEPLASGYERQIAAGTPDTWVANREVLREAQAWFRFGYWRAAALCIAALSSLLALRYWPVVGRRLAVVIGGLLLLDLLAFGHNKRIPQDPYLYYPEIPALDALKMATPGRVLGIECLPANLAQVAGLSDIRGYDAFDPQRWVRLVSVASNKAERDYDYAAIQRFSTKFAFLPPGAIRFHPVINMLGVRYAILRGAPGQGLQPRFQSKDYWVMENFDALPRVYVPKRVETVPDHHEILRRLARPGFDAREVAFVESPTGHSSSIEGTATIRQEIPTRIVVEAMMKTPGLLVLADNWDSGWQAYVDGSPTPILRANYAIRGMGLPAGRSIVDFRYEPRAVALGNRMALAALCVLLVWTCAGLWLQRRARKQTNQTSA